MQILRSSRSTLIVATLAGVAPISGGTSIAQAGGGQWGGGGTTSPTLLAALGGVGSSAPALTLDQTGHPATRSGSRPTASRPRRRRSVLWVQARATPATPRPRQPMDGCTGRSGPAPSAVS